MFDKLMVVVIVIAVIAAILSAVYVGSRNARCLLSADPFLCLEVHETGK